MTNPNLPILKRDAQQNVCQNTFSDRAFQGEYTGTNLIYKGFARAGSDTSDPVWQIALLSYDGSNNLTSIQWPEGTNGAASTEYLFVWDDRASYTYA